MATLINTGAEEEPDLPAWCNKVNDVRASINKVCTSKSVYLYKSLYSLKVFRFASAYDPEMLISFDFGSGTLLHTMRAIMVAL